MFTTSMIKTITPVSIGIGGEMFKKYLLTSKKPRIYFFFIIIEVLLHLGVPDNQILPYLGVTCIQILLCVGVPNN